jgi:hypothetical protein
MILWRAAFPKPIARGHFRRVPKPTARGGISPFSQADRSRSIFLFFLFPNRKSFSESRKTRIDGKPSAWKNKAPGSTKKAPRPSCATGGLELLPIPTRQRLAVAPLPSGSVMAITAPVIPRKITLKSVKPVCGRMRTSSDDGRSEKS